MGLHEGPTILSVAGQNRQIGQIIRRLHCSFPSVYLYFEPAFSLLDREVWPGAEFGTPGISVDEELDIMREILYNPVAGMCPIPMFRYTFHPAPVPFQHCQQCKYWKRRRRERRVGRR